MASLEAAEQGQRKARGCASPASSPKDGRHETRRWAQQSRIDVGEAVWHRPRTRALRALRDTGFGNEHCPLISPSGEGQKGYSLFKGIMGEERQSNEARRGVASPWVKYQSTRFAVLGKPSFVNIREELKKNFLIWVNAFLHICISHLRACGGKNRHRQTEREKQKR